jgi:beta-lactamase superfamily II metal-dependent hydrolase
MGSLMAELTVLDVGHGSAAVVHEGNKAIVIDAGPGTAVLEFLLANGITTLSAILISHADTDHLRGVVALLGSAELTIESIHLNSDAVKRSSIWKALAFELDQSHRSNVLKFHVQLVEGQRHQLGTNVGIDVLAPRQALAMLGPGSRDNKERRISTNTISAVIRVQIEDGPTTMLTGDLDEIGLEHLLETGQELACDILVFPHHGGNVRASSNPTRNTSFARLLLGATTPKTVIFSIGRQSANPNPRPEIIAAVKEIATRRVMCTQMSSNCVAGQTSFETSHLSTAFSTGRSSGLCCAGSIRFGANFQEPTNQAHDDFLDSAAPRALCRRRAQE